MKNKLLSLVCQACKCHKAYGHIKYANARKKKQKGATISICKALLMSHHTGWHSLSATRYYGMNVF